MIVKNSDDNAKEKQGQSALNIETGCQLLNSCCLFFCFSKNMLPASMKMNSLGGLKIFHQ
jgi:hypothetical protein